jgi:hypothetical protein
MTKIARPALWKRATIDSALSIFKLIRLTNASGTVELRSPAELCPECHNRAEVLVLPTRLCADCWSRKIIASWRVPPCVWLPAGPATGCLPLVRHGTNSPRILASSF